MWWPEGHRHSDWSGLGGIVGVGATKKWVKKWMEGEDIEQSIKKFCCEWGGKRIARWGFRVRGWLPPLFCFRLSCKSLEIVGVLLGGSQCRGRG